MSYLGVRGTGKTRKMIEELSPNSIVVIHAHAFKPYIRKMIYNLRGAEFEKDTKIIVIDHERDVDQLRGINRPVKFDHAWSLHVRRSVYDYVTTWLEANLRSY